MNQVCVQRKLISHPRAAAMAGPLALILALGAGSGPAFAHHSGAMFDNAKTVTITGAVKDYRWSNPHTIIEVVSNSSGAPVVWNIECSTPNILVRKGWGAHSLKPGDAVSMTVHPLRDGGPAALVMTLTTPGGAVLKDHDY
jgi:hypothetical protein